MKRIAIVGFGAAGYQAAAEFRRHDRDAAVDVFSDTPTAPYNPMLTTYFVKGSIPYEAMFPFGDLARVGRELDVRIHADRPVTGFDSGRKALKFADGTEQTYDSILFSTGASAAIPPLPGMNLPGVFSMRTAVNAVKLREALARGGIRDALVIGASWVGIKIVEDLVEAGIACTLVDGLPWMFGAAVFQETAHRLQTDLESKGVAVSCGQMLERIESAAGGRLCAVMQNGSRFEADTIAVCVGVRMNVRFLKDSGLEIGRGIIVDRHMCSSVPGIYAAGDCCEAVDILTGKPRNIGVWLNANRQGQVAGANMAGVQMEFDANTLLNLGHYLNYDFISIGDTSLCQPGDDIYEYEDERYYIRASAKNGRVMCINAIGTGDTNGILKNVFIKSIENPGVPMDVRSYCILKDRGFPESFVDFLGGKGID